MRSTRRRAACSPPAWHAFDRCRPPAGGVDVEQLRSTSAFPACRSRSGCPACRVRVAQRRWGIGSKAAGKAASARCRRTSPIRGIRRQVVDRRSWRCDGGRESRGGGGAGPSRAVVGSEVVGLAVPRNGFVPRRKFFRRTIFLLRIAPARSKHFGLAWASLRYRAGHPERVPQRGNRERKLGVSPPTQGAGAPCSLPFALEHQLM